MKIRKVLISAVVLTLLFGTAAFAESITQDIKVIVNKKGADDNGVLIDNRAYLAVGTLAKTLQAFVTWDNGEKKVTINKPNVHMFTMIDNQAFIGVPKGKYKFRVHAQVDSLTTDIASLKFTISDPYGEETLIEARYAGDENFPTEKEDFILNTKDISYNFSSAGRYTVRFWMKPTGDAPIQVVSEKSIIIK
ncbi:stalk domain-containing protein [Cohnella caldifontis]|uniref:stalk domain-containing protein n=1 Tax=Cohnella caldifontis TaxID=3027471 RepID=UPI0023EC300F|nr:stalk domain-containing protein [Cohnella sp. YIM B05605]